MSVSDRKAIAERLRSLRKSYGLSQKEFADKVGLSQSAISQFEKEERMPSTAALENIAKAFSIPFADLISTTPAEDGKELLISAVAQKLRGMSQEDILTLDRWVDRMAPKKDDATQS